MFNIGEIYTDNKFGAFRIVSNVINNYVEIEFINPNMFGFNTRTKAQPSNIKYGNIVDVYQPTILGIGCVGNAVCYVNGANKKEYNTWYAMLKMCHENKDLDICLRWKCFEFFEYDIMQMKDYDKYLNDGYVFFKMPSSNIYDETSCKFIPKQYSAAITNASKSSLGFFGVNYNGYNYACKINGVNYGTFDNVEAAANMYNIVARHNGLPNYMMNDVPYMSIIDVYSHKKSSLKRPGLEEMITLVDESDKAKLQETIEMDDSKINLSNKNKIWRQGTENAFRIINDCGVVNGRHRVDIQFINLNIFGEHTIIYGIEARRLIRNEVIKDWYYPYYFGVACKGNAVTTYYDQAAGRYLDCPDYKIWRSMICRCYDKSYTNYNNYGGIGITVDLNWRCFEIFRNTLPQVPNYNLWLNNPSDYQLDKDILQANAPHNKKVYSVKTCMFVSSRDNTLEKHHRKNLNSTGYFGVFPNKSDNYFCRVNGDYYFTFDDVEAAASMYNKVCRKRGYPEEYLNDLGEREMEMDEIMQHRLNGKRPSKNKSLYVLMDPSKKNEC